MKTEEKKTYNGWTNYGTWCVNLWLDNEQGLRDSLVERAMDFADPTSAVNARYEMQQYIRELVEEGNPINGDVSLYADLLDAALSEVNWYEIADVFLEEAEENIKKG